MSHKLAASIMHTPQVRAISLIFAVTVLWVAIETIGSLLPAQVSPYETVWMRYGVHLLVLVAFIRPRHTNQLWRTHRPLPQLGRGLLMLGMPVCYILSTKYMSVTSTWAVFWSAPLLALALAALFLHETVGPMVWLATAVAFAGELIVLHPHHDLLSPAIVLPFGMALCFVAYLLASRLLRDEPMLPSLFYTAAAVFVPLSVTLPLFWRPLTWTAGIELAAIGVLGLLLLYCLDRGLELAEVNALAPFLLAAPLWGIGVDSMFVESAPGPRVLLGSVIIVGALTVLLLGNRHKSVADADSAQRPAL